MRFPSTTMRKLLVVALAIGTLTALPASAQAAVPSTTVRTAESAKVLAERRAIILAAQSWVIQGEHYTWGGGHGKKPGPTLGNCGPKYEGPTPCKDTSVVGFDCSGFVREALYQGGLGDWKLNANGFLTSKKLHSIKKSQLKPGDLIFFGPSKSKASHVAIYAGNGMMFEAANHKLGVVESPITRRSDVIAYKTEF